MIPSLIPRSHATPSHRPFDFPLQSTFAPHAVLGWAAAVVRLISRNASSPRPDHLLYLKELKLLYMNLRNISDGVAWWSGARDEWPRRQPRGQCRGAPAPRSTYDVDDTAFTCRSRQIWRKHAAAERRSGPACRDSSHRPHLQLEWRVSRVPRPRPRSSGGNVGVARPAQHPPAVRSVVGDGVAFIQSAVNNK
jgi:hypothetical protein